MKLNTFVKYNFTADLYVPRSQNDSEGSILYEFQENIKCSIVSGRQQSSMFTSGPIEYGARLLEVKNPRGELIFFNIVDEAVEQYDIHVHSNEPVIDVYGNIVGYRQMLRRPQPLLTDVRPSAEG